MNNSHFSFIKNKKFKNFIIYGFGQAFNLLVPFMLIPFIVDKCGEENFGKTALAFSIYIFFIAFIDFCCDLIGVKEISENRNNIKHLNNFISKFFIIKTVILIISIVLLLVLIQFTNVFGDEKKMFLFGLTILIGQFINPTWILQGLESFGLLTIFNIVSKTIYLFGVFYFLTNSNDYFLINFWFGNGLIISGLLIWFFIRKKYKLEFIPQNKTTVLSYMNSNKGIVFSQIFVWFQLYAVIIIISFLGTELEVGQFRITDQIINIFRTISLLCFNFLFPGMCYDFSINKKNALKKWKLYNLACLAFVVISCVILFIFSYDIINYFNATNIYLLTNLLKLYLIFPILHYINISLKQLLIANNLNKKYVKITIFTTIINLLGMYFLYNIFYLYGIVYSFIFTETLMILLSIIIILNHNKKKNV